MAEHLFNRGRLSDALHSQRKAAEEHIKHLSSGDLARSGVREDILGQFSIEPLTLDEEAAERTLHPVQVDISRDPNRYISYDRSGPYFIQGSEFRVAIPFQGDEALWHLRPDRWQSILPLATVHASGTKKTIELVARLPNDVATAEKFNSLINEELKSIRFYVDSQREQLRQFNEDLAGLVDRALDSARKKHAGNADLATLLGARVVEANDDKPARRPAAASTAIPAQKARPTPSRTRSKAQTSDGSGKVFDLFISHASEDKALFARPLAVALERAGIAVWLDEAQLTLGDSLRRSIDAGLAASRFGAVVISKSFLAKEWTKRELDGLAAREINGVKVILPIWYGITYDDLLKFSPTLADRLAVDATKLDLDSVVAAILKAIRK